MPTPKENAAILILSLMIFLYAGETELKLEPLTDYMNLTFISMTLIEIAAIAAAAYTLIAIHHEAEKKVKALKQTKANL